MVSSLFFHLQDFCNSLPEGQKSGGCFGLETLCRNWMCVTLFYITTMDFEMKSSLRFFEIEVELKKKIVTDSSNILVFTKLDCMRNYFSLFTKLIFICLNFNANV